MKYIPTWERKSRAEGKRDLIVSLLECRFGPLPDWARKKTAAADSDTLDSLAPGLLTESSIEDVLAPALSEDHE